MRLKERPAIEIIDYLPQVMWLVQTPRPWGLSYHLSYRG